MTDNPRQRCAEGGALRHAAALALTAAAGVLWTAAVDARPAFRCSDGLVREGDSIATVARRCPEPFWTEVWESPRTVGQARGEPVLSIDTIETWYFNFGANRLMRRLVFRNGELWRIQALRHGLSWEPGSRSCGPQDLEKAGDTPGEIWARCGPPDHRHTRGERVQRGLLTGAGVPEIVIDVWTYEFGDARRVRELTFRDGRLHRVETVRP